MMVCSSPSSESSSPNMVVAPTPPGSDPDPELHTFREAISLSGKNCCNIVVNVKKIKLTMSY